MTEASYQLLAISFQLLTFSYQPSAPLTPLAAAHRGVGRATFDLCQEFDSCALQISELKAES
jgi:hypothetical protein